LDQKFKGSSSEANLDIQYALSLSYPVKNHFFSTGGLGPLVPDLDQPTQESNQNEPYEEFFQALIDNQDPAQRPHTVTISYGENEQSVPASYAKTVCDQISQLGTLGVSVIISSGDEGVGSACKTNDGKNTTRFMPIFPAACPSATSVGSTQYINPEIAIGFSSGGFSDLFPRPAYQDKKVSAYLSNLKDKWAGLYNQKGRGFPDIAAQGRNFKVIDQGATRLIGGTSASAPVIAAVVGLLNAKRLQSGQPPLGFLNPWLYSAEDISTDIVGGGSNGCTGRSRHSRQPTGGKVAGATWAAVPGWDPVTGIGTPKFDQMLRKLPAASKRMK
jgi:tripeptidyl-peptidase-1